MYGGGGGDLDSGEALEELRDEVEGHLKRLLSNRPEFFDEVGGAAAWRQLLSSMPRPRMM